MTISRLTRRYLDIKNTSLLKGNVTALNLTLVKLWNVTKSSNETYQLQSIIQNMTFTWKNQLNLSDFTTEKRENVTSNVTSQSKQWETNNGGETTKQVENDLLSYLTWQWMVTRTQFKNVLLQWTNLKVRISVELQIFETNPTRQ